MEDQIQPEELLDSQMFPQIRVSLTVKLLKHVTAEEPIRNTLCVSVIKVMEKQLNQA